MPDNLWKLPTKTTVVVDRDDMNRWLKIFEKSFVMPSDALPQCPRYRAKNAFAENMGWIDQFNRGWWVQNIGRLPDLQGEFTMFPTEFAARMFAAGMSCLIFKGYGETRETINPDSTRHLYFQELPSP